MLAGAEEEAGALMQVRTHLLQQQPALALPLRKSRR